MSNFKNYTLWGWLLFFTTISVSFAQEPSKSEKLDRYFKTLVDLKAYNGVVAIRQKGQQLLYQAYQLDQTVPPTLSVNPKSQFDLRSIAKLFGKASIIKLEQEGLLKRTDFIEKYLPDFPQGDKITLDHLMHNRSGLPRELSSGGGNTLEMSPDELMELIKKESLEFEPGTDSRYSNLGFHVLYYVVGKVHGSTFAQYLRTTFFTPLDMPNSGSHYLDPSGDLKNYAYGHYLDDQKKIVALKELQEDEYQLGNLYSSLDDLQKFIDFLDQEPYKSALAVGGGIGQAGGTQGKRAYVYKNVEQDYSIIFLANYDEIPFQKITEDLKNILEGKSYELPKKVNRQALQLAPDSLKKYQGTYDFAEIGHLQLKVVLEGRQLMVYQNGKSAGALFPEGKGIFFWDAESPESFQFIPLEGGTFKVLMDFKGAKWEGLKIKE